MTSAPVADVNALLGNITSAKNKENSKEHFEDFQNVFDRQRGKEIEPTEKKMPRIEEKDALHEKMRVKDSKIPTEKGKDFQKKMELGSQEELEMCQEFVLQMLVEIAQELKISVQEVENIFKEMNFQSEDLTSQDFVKNFVMKSNSIMNPMELVTNQELYSKVQDFTEKLENIQSDFLNEMGISKEELKGLLEKFERVQNSEKVSKVAEIQKGELVSPSEMTDSKILSSTENGEEANTFDFKVTKLETKQEHTNENAGGNFKDSTFPQPVFLNDSKLENNMSVVGKTFTTKVSSQIMNQVVDYMNTVAQTDVTELEMQLHPESLGKVTVHIKAKEGVITAQFTTQNEAVKAVLESQMVQLKDNFTQQGIKVDAVEVAVGNQGFHQEMDQNGQAFSRNQEEQKSRSRRLRVDLLERLDVEDLTEEEQLTVRMMKENGNTVDYTV